VAVVPRFLHAQSLRAAAGVAVAHWQGRELGTGTGLDMDLRLRARSLPSLALVTRVSLTKFGRTTLWTSSTTPFSGVPTRLVREYSVLAAVSSIAVGPEVTRSVRGIHVYAHALGGASRVVSGGNFVSAYLRSTGSKDLLEQQLSPRPVLAQRTGTVVAMVVGVGLRRPFVGGLIGDIGASRMAASAVAWTSEQAIAYSRPESPYVDAKRSVAMWSLRVGVSYAP
jgi:hypothetical protein